MKKSLALVALSLLVLNVMVMHFISSDFIDSGDSLSPSYNSGVQSQSLAANSFLSYKADIYLYLILGCIFVIIVILIILLISAIVKKKENL